MVGRFASCQCVARVGSGCDLIATVRQEGKPPTCSQTDSQILSDLCAGHSESKAMEGEAKSRLEAGTSTLVITGLFPVRK